MTIDLPDGIELTYDLDRYPRYELTIHKPTKGVEKYVFGIKRFDLKIYRTDPIAYIDSEGLIWKKANTLWVNELGSAVREPQPGWKRLAIEE